MNDARLRDIDHELVETPADVIKGLTEPEPWDGFERRGDPEDRRKFDEAKARAHSKTHQPRRVNSWWHVMSSLFAANPNKYSLGYHSHSPPKPLRADGLEPPTTQFESDMLKGLPGMTLAELRKHMAERVDRSNWPSSKDWLVELAEARKKRYLDNPVHPECMGPADDSGGMGGVLSTTHHWARDPNDHRPNATVRWVANDHVWDTSTQFAAGNADGPVGYGHGGGGGTTERVAGTAVIDAEPFITELKPSAASVDNDKYRREVFHERIQKNRELQEKISQRGKQHFMPARQFLAIYGFLPGAIKQKGDWACLDFMEGRMVFSIGHSMGHARDRLTSKLMAVRLAAPLRGWE